MFSKGMTVDEVRKLLANLPGDLIVVGHAGDGTVAPISTVQVGVAYEYTKQQTYGGSNYLFTSKHDVPGNHKQQQQVVYIE